jgi:hypothetical protein
MSPSLCNGRGATVVAGDDVWPAPLDCTRYRHSTHSRRTNGALVSASSSGDAITRVEQLSRAVNAVTAETMRLGRALIRLTVEGDKPCSGSPRRGYRRIEWIERSLESVHHSLPRKEFDRLVSAISVLMGWEPLIVLQDLRGLEQREAEDVLAFAARAVVDAALRAKQ